MKYGNIFCLELSIDMRYGVMIALTNGYDEINFFI